MDTTKNSRSTARVRPRALSSEAGFLPAGPLASRGVGALGVPSDDPRRLRSFGVRVDEAASFGPPVAQGPLSSRGIVVVVGPLPSDDEENDGRRKRRRRARRRPHRADRQARGLSATQLAPLVLGAAAGALVSLAAVVFGGAR